MEKNFQILLRVIVKALNIRRDKTCLWIGTLDIVKRSDLFHIDLWIQSKPVKCPPGFFLNFDLL